MNCYNVENCIFQFTNEPTLVENIQMRWYGGCENNRVDSVNIKAGMIYLLLYSYSSHSTMFYYRYLTITITIIIITITIIIITIAMAIAITSNCLLLLFSSLLGTDPNKQVCLPTVIQQSFDIQTTKNEQWESIYEEEGTKLVTRPLKQGIGWMRSIR